MEFWIEALEEAVRTVALIGGATFLAWRGHTHGLRGRRGWGYILAGLTFLAVGSVIDLVDEFSVHDTLPAFLIGEPWGVFEIFSEFVGPGIGTSLLILGFLLWLPLPARLSKAELDLREANRELAERAAREATAQRRRVQELEDLAAIKTQFLNNAAHELATPLTPIQLHMASLRNARFGTLTPPQAEAVDLLGRNLDRLGGIVRDLMEAARLQAGRLKLDCRPLRAGATASDVVRSFAEKARHDGITLVGSGLGQDHLVAADDRRLAQVLTNLLHNALKFTPRGGNVEVALAADGGDAVLTVRDDGPGLSAEQVGRLFAPFTQVHEAAHGSLGGSGLGLYISKGLTEQQGGHLSCRSDGLGKGCTFEVRFPLLAAVPTMPAPAAVGMG